MRRKFLIDKLILLNLYFNNKNARNNISLILQILVKGKPDTQPQRGNICQVNYIGKLDNGMVVENRQNVKIQVGDVEVKVKNNFGHSFKIKFQIILMGLGCSRIGYGHTFNASGRKSLS